MSSSPAARAAARQCVIEGPRALAGALDRDAPVVAVYLGEGAERAFAPLITRVRDRGIRVEQLRDGVLEALNAGQTNYPPSDGVPELRQAVQNVQQQAEQKPDNKK